MPNSRGRKWKFLLNPVDCVLQLQNLSGMRSWHEFFFEGEEKWHKSILTDMNFPHGIACAALLNKEKVHNSCIHDCLFNAEQLTISWQSKIVFLFTMVNSHIHIIRIRTCTLWLSAFVDTELTNSKTLFTFQSFLAFPKAVLFQGKTIEFVIQTKFRRYLTKWRSKLSSI